MSFFDDQQLIQIESRITKQPNQCNQFLLMVYRLVSYLDKVSVEE